MKPHVNPGKIPGEPTCSHAPDLAPNAAES